MLPSADHSPAADMAKTLTRAQQDALRAIAFFRRQRKVGQGWLVGEKRLSEKLVERLEQMELVEESFVRGEPVLQFDDRWTSDQGPAVAIGPPSIVRGDDWWLCPQGVHCVAAHRSLDCAAMKTTAQ